MDRLFPIHFETDGGGYEDVGGGEVEYEDISDAGEETSEAWAPSQDEWTRMTQFQEQAMPVLEQLGSVLQSPLEGEGLGGEQDQQQEGEFDPFDPQSVQSYIQDSIQRGIAQSLGPFEGLLGTVAAREGETLAKGELARIEGSIGAFDKDAAFLVASGLIEQGHDPARALESAAQFSRDFEQRTRADERAKYKQELQELAGAPQETRTASASAVDGVPVPTGPDRYRIAVERALGTRDPGIPAG